MRGEEEVEDDEQDEDEEEVVVLGDADCAAMRAGAALQAAAASAAATAGRMEAISSGCGLGAGGCKGRAAIRRSRVPTWSAAVCGGGLGLWSQTSGFGWAGLLQLARVRVSASAGGNSSRGLHLGAGWDGPRLHVPCVCVSLGRVGGSWGVRLGGTAPRAFSQDWRGTTHHHQQRIRARKGRELPPGPSARNGKGPPTTTDSRR